MIRTFIAIDLPSTVREAIGKLESELRGTQASVRWVRPESIHLTLKFLGNVSQEQVEGIQKALQEVASAVAPFRLQPIGCGAFPSVKQARIVWVGLGGVDGKGDKLLGLQQAVEKALIPLGFKEEDRSFKPHLTLGRVKGRQHLYSLREVLVANQAFEAEAFDVTELVLYKSELLPDGARYTPLFRAVFSGDSG
ncbi:MAG: RNA 2',3'-cyclic phosphodiesterase [Syntrophobacteraceae bacterium]